MTTTITTDEFLARRLPVDGTFNVRDVGGYATVDGLSVKWRTLLRGDAFHDIDADGQAFLAEFGLRTEVDLREDGERSEAPTKLQSPIRLVEIPLYSYIDPAADQQGGTPLERPTFRDLEDTYRWLIRNRGPVLVAVIRELVQPGTLPAVIHCTAGKDRTGIVVALVLSAIGVPDEVIAADFAATSLFLSDEFRTMILARIRKDGYDESRLARMFTCEPELILGVLEEIRATHGDVGSYLVHFGLSAQDLDSLRGLLLEETQRPIPNDHIDERN